MIDDKSFSERLAVMTRFARAQLSHPQSGNWFSMDVRHGDWSCQYAWFYEDGVLICQQCDNLIVIPDLNIKGRAEKADNFSFMAPTVFRGPGEPRHRKLPTRWAVIKQLVKWLWRKERD